MEQITTKNSVGELLDQLLLKTSADFNSLVGNLRNFDIEEAPLEPVNKLFSQLIKSIKDLVDLKMLIVQQEDKPTDLLDAKVVH